MVHGYPSGTPTTNPKTPMPSIRPLPNRNHSPLITSRFALAIALPILLGINAAEAASSDKPSDFKALTANMKPGAWLELPGTISDVFVDKAKTQGDGEIVGAQAVITAWNGAAWDENCGYFLGGGHADYGGNEVYTYCWAGKKPLQWEVLMPPSKADPDDHSPCPRPKEGPRAYHTYDGLTYVPDTKSVFIWGSVGYCQNNMMGNDEVVELLLAPTPKWKLHPQGPINAFAHTAYNDKNKQVYIWQGSGPAYIFDPKSLKTEASGDSTADYGANANLVYDNQRNVLWASTGLGLFQFTLDPKGYVSAFKLIASNKEFPAGFAGNNGMALRKGKLYFWPGNKTVIKFDPDDGKWATYNADKGPTSASNNGIFSKWHYLEKYDAFVGVSHFKQGMWVWKPDDGKGQQDTRKISVCQPKVKPCTEYRLANDAIKDLSPGSAIKFSAGHYGDSAVITQNNIKLSAEPGTVVEGIAEGKATFVARGADMVFDNFEITLPTGSASSNEACFRGESKNLTLKHIDCHDVQMGVIGGAGTLTIENSRFENSGLNGNADLGHMVYACSNGECENGSLVVRDSVFFRMGINRPGHGIKSRAPKNLIENVVIASLDSTSGRAIDISEGGDTTIRNVVMQFGEHSENEDFIAIGLETNKFPMHKNTQTLIENVIAICDRPEPCDFIRYKGPEPKLKNVVLVGAFKFYDDLYPISREGIKIYKSRAEAGLKDYPDIPKKWLKIDRQN